MLVANLVGFNMEKKSVYGVANESIKIKRSLAVVPIYVERWGGKFAILPQFCTIFCNVGDKARPLLFSREQIK